jgi:ribosomal protein S18 acetylase RimI-like enzyme
MNARKVTSEHFRIVDRLPTPHEYNSLRAAVGWTTLEVAVLTEALPRSILGICVEKDDDLIAFARVVGDGGINLYIQDVVVHPDFQSIGIGSRMMSELFLRLDGIVPVGASVSLIAANEVTGFYERFGFRTRAENRHMLIKWKKS